MKNKTSTKQKTANRIKPVVIKSLPSVGMIKQEAEQYVNRQYNRHVDTYFTDLKKEGIRNTSMEQREKDFIAGAKYACALLKGNVL